jgi:hypothetical protein
MENTIANIRILGPVISGQLYVGPFQLHQFDIGGKGPIQMFSIHCLGV